MKRAPVAVLNFGFVRCANNLTVLCRVGDVGRRLGFEWNFPFLANTKGSSVGKRVGSGRRRLPFNTSHQLVYQVEREKTNNYTRPKWWASLKSRSPVTVTPSDWPPADRTAARICVNLLDIRDAQSDRSDSRHLFTPILRNPYNPSLFLILLPRSRVTHWLGIPARDASNWANYRSYVTDSFCLTQFSNPLRPRPKK